jgi:predicted metal-dependent peptidase
MTIQEMLSRNLRRAVSKDVGLAGILLYVPAVTVTDQGRIAWTDGRRMYFAERYFEYQPEEQVAIAIHEALHVALRHVQRGDALENREGSAFDSRCWNIACDAVINHSIRACHWCALPSGAWFPEDCLAAEQLKQRPAELWTVEEIYAEIQRDEERRDKLLSKGDRVPGADIDGTGEASFPEQGVHEQSLEQGIWRQRLLRAQAGSAPGSVLRRLAAQVPKSAVRWEAVLRNFLTTRLMPLTEESWSRPSRRTLALGKDAVWMEPGTNRRRGIRRAGVVIDTSGSIDDRLLHTFIVEINGLMTRTGCEVLLVDCDARVQQVSMHRKPIQGYVAKGGGGTDFRPAIDALRRVPLDVAVYFTDLEGAFPEKKPAFPLLWAATQDLVVPFGRKLLLPAKGGL